MRAVVVGAGIGGLTAAIALRQAGIDVDVYERRPTLQAIQVGGGIHLWQNGMRGLQRIGVAERIEALGGRAATVDRAEFRSAKGSLLASWSGSRLERELGAPTVGVVRSELHRVLADEFGGERLHLGASFEAFVDEGDAVMVRFGGRPEERADVLVGADGIQSTVRAALFGAEPPRSAKYASWQAFADDAGALVPVGSFRVLWGRGARFLFYRVDANRVYWEGIFATEPGGSDPEGGRKAAVLAKFGSWSEPVRSIVEATEEPAITRGDIYDRPPIKRWGTGRVTLLGDAAHAMTNAMGQGANQAIEDGIVLADSLRRATDATAALREYERRRQKRTAGVVNMSARLTALSRWKRPWAVAVRDAGLRLVFARVAQRAQHRLLGYDF